jgi:hypothetical protein
MMKINKLNAELERKNVVFGSSYYVKAVKNFKSLFL